jgi:hypothetical protein
MLGLTLPGLLHTAVSLIAVAAGPIALVRYKQISSKHRVGKVHVVMTIFTGVTAFSIFRHGGFGEPHASDIVTLVVLGVAGAAEYSNLFGPGSAYVQTVSYAAPSLFHLIPGATETTTHLPLGACVWRNVDAAALQVVAAALLIATTLQVRWLRAKRPQQA